MVGRLYSRAKTFLRIEKFEEKVVLKELEMARKLIDSLFNLHADEGGYDTTIHITVHRVNIPEMKRKFQQARGFVLDARKHDIKLLNFGKKLLEDLNSLPPQLKERISLSEQTEIAMSESIVPTLNFIAQALAGLQISINPDGTWDQREYPAIVKMHGDLNGTIRRIREIFRVHAQVAEALESVKQM